MPTKTSLALLLSLVAAVAAAQTPSKKDREAAKQHFAAGKKLYEVGKYAEAIDEFTQAQRLAPNPKVLFNIAQAHRLMGDKAKAKAVYEEYLAKESTGPVAEEARGHVEALGAALRAEEEQARLAREKEAAERAQREEEARKQAEEEERQRAEKAAEAERQVKAAEEAERQRRTAEEERARREATERRLAEAEKARQASTLTQVMRWGGLTIGILGGITLVYGVYEGTEAQRIEEDLKADVMQLGYYPDDVRERMRAGNRADARFLFGTIAGGLALVGGGVLFYVAGGVDLEPQVSENGVGALFRIRF